MKKPPTQVFGQQNSNKAKVGAASANYQSIMDESARGRREIDNLVDDFDEENGEVPT